MTEAKWEVQIEPVAISGAGVLHQQGNDVVHIPAMIRASVLGLPWDVSFTIGLSDDDELVPEITELRMRQRKGGAPIGVDLIRSFRLGLARDEAVKAASTHWIRAGDSWRLDFEGVSPRRMKAATQRRSRRVTDADVRRAAEAYQEAKRSGRRDCLVAVAEACGVSRATAARYVNRAIEAGIIEEDR